MYVYIYVYIYIYISCTVYNTYVVRPPSKTYPFSTLVGIHVGTGICSFFTLLGLMENERKTMKNTAFSM